ncbi:GTP-binding protein [Paenibacillus sacheonensis]|uniref:GTP-binding protein n=1 Tax=Paenibacillus sacheonensis TaxID=742054 RepID=A0A7X4YRY9_9BACL|nr:putative glycoside hydrolase [Paenibacillus sacheonensis]NBC71428.1 GTP-binding protein [Paenibacillus sacheonensis]
MTSCSGQTHKNDPGLPPLPSQPLTNSSKSLRIHSIQTNRKPTEITKFRITNGYEANQSRYESRSRPAIQAESQPQRTTPLRSLSNHKQPVRGIYVSGWVAGSENRLNHLIQLVDKTDLNAMVIDVKNDYGQLTYRSSLKAVKAIGADRHVAIRDIGSLIRKLKAKHIYVIGRIVTFKDPLYAKQYPSMALQRKSGGVWRDAQGKAWLDPFQQQVRTYNTAIAAEAASNGFDEIQFDYVRFPDNGGRVDREVRYSDTHGKNKSQVIAAFLGDARRQIHGRGARVSADVFGLVTSSTNDMGIGQSWRSISSAVDVISPMTYPSHYSTGMYGVRQPDLSPYAIIHHAMTDAMHRNAVMKSSGTTTAAVRPWLQSFTAKWVHPHQTYGAEQVNKQVQAARELGVREFLLWSSNCKYDYRSSF